MSVFALQMLAYVVKFARRPDQAFLFGYWTEGTLEVIGRHYRRAAFPPLSLFEGETVHYEGPDALIEISGGDGYLYPNFRCPEARRRFEEIVADTGFEWGM